ncbi:hypothetical protein PIB30_059859 [Stylosanthes scabra]|uniref:Uncharacterized protein n=1 Tax=Stylosanthes scabra TaxID=79078 RepID=A0ABU6QK88_9FABA|nr:hypothetical protein [Stylosanthes scabra]
MEEGCGEPRHCRRRSREGTKSQGCCCLYFVSPEESGNNAIAIIGATKATTNTASLDVSLSVNPGDFWVTQGDNDSYETEIRQDGNRTAARRDAAVQTSPSRGLSPTSISLTWDSFVVG